MKQMKMRRINRIYTAIAIFLIFILLIFINLHYKEPFIITPNEDEIIFNITDQVNATSAIIYDLKESKIIAGKNEFIPMPIASITKLASALVSYEYLDENDITTITDEDFKIPANTNLRKADRWASIDLLKYSLITSSNRGINAISRTIEEKTGEMLVDLMNEFVRQNKLVSTHFVNSTGLDAHTSLSGSESSAYEIALLSQLFLSNAPELAETTTRANATYYSLDGAEYVATNTNILVNDISQILLSKTGFTDIAGGALVVIINIEPNHPIVLIALNSTKENRFSDIQNLIELSRELINTN